MLQIASGRFFNSTELHEHAGNGILYSNFAWVREIETCAGTLVSADAMIGTTPTSWIVRYINRMEKLEGPGAIVRVGDAEIVEQFQLLCTLGLRAFFHVERDVVIHTCRTRPVGRHDRNPPSMFVTRIIQSEVTGTIDDEIRLQKFIDNALHLPRVKYTAVLACARAFCDSLVVSSYNIHLAYSMLVYALESLSQQFHAFDPAWEHFDENARQELDTALADAPDAVAKRVKEILTQTQSAKLMARFVAFVIKHVGESFYLAESPPTTAGIRASDLTRALQTAYATRSGFVHRLEPIREQICIPELAKGEVLEWDRRPYLTYRGLVRLVQHVLTTFVATGERLETEQYSWRKKLPGVVTLRVAPRYWIWKADVFSSAASPGVLGGFLSHLNEVKIGDGAITDMRAVVKKCFELIPTAKLQEKRAMLLLVLLFNKWVREEDRVSGWEDCVEEHLSALEDCCIERLVADLLLGNEWEWSPTQCAECVEEYLRTRHHKSTLELPWPQQRGLMLGVYNKMLTAGNKGAAAEWAKRTLLDEAGVPEMQSLIESTAAKSECFNLATIMWGHLKRS